MPYRPFRQDWGPNGAPSGAPDTSSARWVVKKETSFAQIETGTASATCFWYLNSPVDWCKLIGVWLPWYTGDTLHLHGEFSPRSSKDFVLPQSTSQQTREAGRRPLPPDAQWAASERTGHRQLGWLIGFRPESIQLANIAFEKHGQGFHYCLLCCLLGLFSLHLLRLTAQPQMSTV